MNKLKHIVLILFTGISLIYSGGCNSKKVPVNSGTIANYEEKGFVKATIIKYELDGCSYMVLLPTKEKLEPKDLPEEFKKEDLPVWIKYTIEKNTMSICMAGRSIDIKEIELRKE